MNKNFIHKNFYILIINLLVLLCFILGYGKFGDVIFDSFREIYIPEQMLKGQILYKNIFNIYAPFGYIFNSFIIKIFGSSLKVFYFIGLFLSLSITNLIFFISNKFFDKKFSFCIALFFITSAIISANVFNCIFPYSYGMTYGLLFILGSMYAALNKKFLLAYLMYSFSVCSKYEFLLLLPVLIIASFKYRNYKHLIAFILPFIITFTPLFIQGIGVENLLVTAELILSMSSTKTLYWFYSVTGLIFRWELIPIYLINLIKIAIPLTITYFIKSKYILPFIFIYCYFISTPEILIYIFPMILFTYIFKFKTLSYKEQLVIPACILASAKVFWGMTMQSYGVYFIPFGLIPAFILIPKKLKKSLLIIILAFAVSFGIKNTINLHSKSIKLESSKGIVYTTPLNGASINKLIAYLQEKTSTNEKVLIYPECLSVNVLSQRDSDNKFYSLIPLYIETFGEELIMKRLELKQPEYIVVSNINTSNYYYTYFGIDYAEKILEYISSNYDKVEEIGDGLKFNIYRLKSHHPFQPHA